MDSQGQLLYIALKNRDITKLQVFIYNIFNYIKQIHAIKGYNGYKKTYQQIKNEIHEICKDDI